MKYDCRVIIALTYLITPSESGELCASVYTCYGYDRYFYGFCSSCVSNAVLAAGGGTYCNDGTYHIYSCSCISGYTADIANNRCVRPLCSPGYYRSSNVCAQCPAGSYSSTTESLSCTQCSAGTYSLSRATSCITCGIGQYSSTGATTCTPCTAIPNAVFTGSSSADNCPFTCTAGTFGVYGTGSVLQACVVCVAGQHVVSTSCLPCAAGSYCPTSTSQLPCPANSMSIAGASAVTDCKCNAGLYQQSGTCVTCPPGQYSSVTGATICTTCSAAFYCTTTTATPCDITMYCPAGSAVQTPCPQGYYCGDTSMQTICPAGFRCAVGSTAPTPCNTTMYCPAGSTAQLPCAAGPGLLAKHTPFSR